MTEHEPPETPAQVQLNINGLFDEIFELNTQLFAAHRKQIENMSIIADAFRMQAERCEEIIELLAIGADLVARSSGDLLINQLGFERDGDEEIDEED